MAIATTTRPAAAQPWARAFRAARITPDALLGLALGIILAAIALGGNGGLQLGPTTNVELSLDALGGLAGLLAVLSAPRGRLHGGPALFAFAALAALTAASVAWAVQPDAAWQEAARTTSYLAVFASGIALVRVAPERWPALLGAIVIATFVVSMYALLTKVFPAGLNADETYARLREPFGYWNAVGLMAALGVPACLGLASRRTGHAALNAAAYPVLGVLILTILLAYSRGSLLAVLVGVIFWFAFVPLRLRGFAALATGAFGAVLVALWTFGIDGLSKDNQSLSDRVSGGHELGLAILVMVVLLSAAGLGVGFAAARKAPAEATRRRIGATILLLLAFVPVIAVGALALSSRGLGGSISKGWHQLTDPNAKTPANSPDRLTAVASVRARYYDEGLKVMRARPLVGAGAGGFATARQRFRKDQLDVRHAHSYVIQTLSDLGILGLAVSLVLLVAWAVAAVRAAGLTRQGRRLAHSPEQVGLITLGAVVVTFGVHSAVDWTWFVPGTAVIAILAAGWVAGRGPIEAPSIVLADPLRTRLRDGLRSPLRLSAAFVLVAGVLLTMWMTWQPLRSSNADDQAITALTTQHPARALSLAEDAHRIEPLAVEPLFDLAAVDEVAGRKDRALAAFQQAVQLQPQNGETWARLADFELNEQGNAHAALTDLGPALYLDPQNPGVISLFLAAQRAIGVTTPTVPAGTTAAAAAGAGATGASGTTGATGATSATGASGATGATGANVPGPTGTSGAITPKDRSGASKAPKPQNKEKAHGR